MKKSIVFQCYFALLLELEGAMADSRNKCTNPADVPETRRGVSQIQLKRDSGDIEACNDEACQKLSALVQQTKLALSQDLTPPSCEAFCLDRPGCDCLIPWPDRCKVNSCATCSDCRPTPPPTPTPTPAPTPAPTPPPPIAPVQGICLLVGDPHIKIFDKKYTHNPPFKYFNFYNYGDYWFVKSARIHVQGRLWSTRPDGNSMTRALAIGGPFMSGKTIIVEPTNGDITFDGASLKNIIKLPSSSYLEPNGFFQAEYKKEKAFRPRKDGTYAEVNQLTISMKEGIKVKINRYGTFLNVLIYMFQADGGQDGLCGNFNLDETDDTTDLIKQRMGKQVGGGELLFTKKEYNYDGCYSAASLGDDMGSNLDETECSLACSSYKYFGRTGAQKCSCGNDMTTFTSVPDTSCNCQATNLGSSSCVYIYDDAKQPPANDISSCADPTTAETVCRDALGSSPDPEVLATCISDVCFGGTEFADAVAVADSEGDAAEAKIANSCSDIPHPALVQAGETCAQSSKVTDPAGPGCTDPNANKYWKLGYCRYSCYQNGRGYAGDVCTYKEPEPPALPAGFCSDNPSPYMVSVGERCLRSPRRIQNCDKCTNGDQWWLSNKFCQYSCWAAGCGYTGDDCKNPWPQKGGENTKCDVGANADGTIVNNIQACQDLALSSGHKLYSFKKNMNSDQGRCITTDSCGSPLTRTRWLTFRKDR